MRHVPEKLYLPLLRILDEYEAEVRSVKKKTLAEHIKLYDVARIRLAITKKHVKK